MDQKAIENWHIIDVYQNQLNESRIDIYFKIKNQTYCFVVRKAGDNLFKPFFVYHESLVDCSFCDEQNAYCLPLEPYLLDVFKRLIEFPAIRLEWLYIPHVEV